MPCAYRFQAGLWQKKKTVLLLYPNTIWYIQSLQLASRLLETSSRLAARGPQWAVAPGISISHWELSEKGDHLANTQYAIRKVQETNLGLDMNGILQVLTWVDDFHLIRAAIDQQKEKQMCY